MPSGNIFSHPTYIPTSSNMILTGYNLLVSRGTANGPSPFGPYVVVTGYSNYTNNLDIYDSAGGPWDLYRVQPVVTMINPMTQAQTTGVTLPMSRPFYYNTPLYDAQVSQLIDMFRLNYIDDRPVKHTDSSNPIESSGGGTMPFLSDPTINRYYLSFLPNDDPRYFISQSVVLKTGNTSQTASPLIMYTDYFPDEEGGYVDFAASPAAGTYMRMEYLAVRFTNDHVRNALMNAVGDLSLYGINGYEIRSSNNYIYLVNPLPNLDLGNIVCMIAQKRLLSARVQSSFESAEAWKDGKVEYTADPSRSIQAATLHVTNTEEQIRHRANNFIRSSRTYLTRGEFSSFFDTSGILPVYTLFIANYNSYGWWL